MVCIVVDGAAAKAVRVLRARLAPLGHRVIVSPRGWGDEFVADWARRLDCIVVSTDHRAPRLGWIYIPQWRAARKSSRDLATHVIKLAFGRARARNNSGGDQTCCLEGR